MFKIHDTALRLGAEQALNKGGCKYIRPVAYERAEEMRQLGFNVKAVSDYLIVKGDNNPEPGSQLKLI